MHAGLGVVLADAGARRVVGVASLGGLLRVRGAAGGVSSVRLGVDALVGLLLLLLLLLSLLGLRPKGAALGGTVRRLGRVLAPDLVARGERCLGGAPHLPVPAVGREHGDPVVHDLRQRQLVEQLGAVAVAGAALAARLG